MIIIQNTFTSHVPPQAEAAQAEGRWGDAESRLREALSVDPTARLLNTALWLGLCKARLNQRKGGAQTLEACQQAAEHAPDEAEPMVLKVTHQPV